MSRPNASGLAAQAQIALDNGEGGDLPALLGLRSLQYGYSPEADAALLSALSRGFTRQRYLGHSDAVVYVVFSPDGRHVLTASHDHTARLWDAQTGEELRRFAGHTGPVNAAIFSPDGRYVLTNGLDKTIHLWDAQTGQEVRRFTGQGKDMWGMAVSPDGQFVVGADDTVARLWDLRQTGQESRQFAGHTDLVYWVEFSPDGRYLATFSKDKTARLWEVATGQEVQQFAGHTDGVSGGKFSPDGRYLLTTSFDRTARLWDVQTGQEIRRFVGHTDFVYDGFFSSDGRSIVTGSNDKTARLWDIASGQEVRQFIGHTGGVWPVAFSPDGRYVLTGSQDRTARLWEVKVDTEPRRLGATFTHAAGLYAVTLSPDGQYVLTGGRDAIRLWDLQQAGEAVREIKLGATAAIINALAFAPDSNLALTGDNDGIARLWDVKAGQEIGQLVGHTGPVWDVVFSTDGHVMLTGGEDSTARLWDAQTGQELRQFTGHKGPVHGVAFSSDGRMVLTGSGDNTAKLWDTQTGQEVRQLTGHNKPVRDVAFSPDGRFILTGSQDNTAWLWAVETGQKIRQFIGHTDQVIRVAFSPDGRTVLTGSGDQTARLWDTQTGQLVRQFGGHASPVLVVGFSTDGRTTLTGDLQSAYLWRAMLQEVIAFTCAQLSRDFTDEERVLYNIPNNTPTCPEFTNRKAMVEPTWTPVLPGSIKASPLSLAVEMEFLNESANIQMELPIQDVFVDIGNGHVVRPEVLNEEALALPVYRTAVEIPQDVFETPWDAGPYPKGEPLGFTLRDYVAATGRGTYTPRGDRAEVELTFDHLVPHGLYTAWCVTLSFAKATMTESPCLAPDGSAYHFTADENGHGEISMDIKAFPPSTQEAIYEIAVAYHSDGQTHGYHLGEHGRNAHVQLFYDFLPPEAIQDTVTARSQVAEDSSAVAREWMQRLVERVHADMLPPPVAARIYAYAGVTLYEAVVPGMSNYKSLQGQLNDLAALPQPEGESYNWPAVAASAAATMAKALFESPTSRAAFDELRDSQLAALQESGLAPDILDRSVAHGQNLGQAIVAWLETDGYGELTNKPYKLPTGPGYWVPTSASRTKPLAPYWGDLRPFTLTAADACKPAAPVPYSEEPTSAFYAQAREVYDTSQTLTAEQKAMMLFWADAPGQTGTPPGHWVSIVNQISEEQQLPLDKTVELHALVGIGLADAFISCWKQKYTIPLIRPESFIQQHIDPDWEPLIVTPPFPEYTSGHSVASAAAAEILTALVGAIPFTDTTHVNRGLGTRSFASFTDAANEAAMSRLYGGIHYRMGIENGLTQGQCIGRTVLDRVQMH